MTYGKLIRYAYEGAMLAYKHTQEAAIYEPDSYDAHLFNEARADLHAVADMWAAFSETGKAGKEVKA